MIGMFQVRWNLLQLTVTRLLLIRALWAHILNTARNEARR